MIGTAALLSVLGAVAHSLVGERFFAKLRSEAGLQPQVMATIRIVWHSLSVMWIGLAGALAVLRWGPEHPHTAIVLSVATAFLVSAVIAAAGSRWRHPAWVLLVVLAGLSYAGA